MRPITVVAAFALFAAACVARKPATQPSPGIATISVPQRVPPVAQQGTPAVQRSPLTGVYALALIDGHALPFAPAHAGRPANAPPMPEVLSSTLVVRPDGSFIMAMSYRAKAGGVERYFDNPFSGSCTAEGGAYVAQWDEAGRTPLTLKGDTLLLDNEGTIFAYLKRR